MSRAWCLLVLAGCYAPSPPTGAPCTDGLCPAPLVCSPATTTCETTSVAMDAPIDVDAPDGMVDAPDGMVDAMADAMPPDASPIAPFDVLDGAQLLVPCTSTPTGSTCTCDDVTQALTIPMVGMGEQPIYDVMLRIRGVSEGGKYENGVRNGRVYEGGTPSINDGWEALEIVVSNPAAHYYINASDDLTIVPYDYVAKFPIAAGAQVTLFGSGVDGNQETNSAANDGPYTLPGVTTTPSPYLGEFFQLNVVGVQVQ